METTKILDKEAVYEEVTQQVRIDLPYEAHAPGLCLYYALHGIEAIRRRGIRAILQAGSCSWPRIPKDQDDGKVMSHFGYIWSPRDLQSVINVAGGGIPEMHVWIGLPKQQEIVDFTTGRFPLHAEECGMPWPGPRPPKYLWDKPPDWVLYEPIQEAVTLALNKVCEKWSPERALGLIRNMEE